MDSQENRQGEERTKAVKGIRDLLLVIVIVALIVGVVLLWNASN